MREATKKGKLCTYNLSDEEIELIDFNSKNLKCSRSEYVGWLVRNHAKTQDPVKEMEELNEQERRIHATLEEVKKKQTEALNKMKAHQENEKVRDASKKKAIRIIANKIISGADRFEVENVSKFWAMRLNLDYVQLMYEAKSRIREV